MFTELATAATAELAEAGKRKLLRLALFILAGVSIIAAAAFALSGLHTLLSRMYGQATASFAMAGVFLVIALAVFLSRRLGKRREPDKMDIVALAIAAAPLAAELLAKRNLKGAGVVGSLALGALIGQKIGSQSS